MPLRELWKSVNLNLQKLDTTLLNDIRLFVRDTKSLVLVVLTPFLILSILINIFYFSDVSESIKGVSFGVCDLDGSGFSIESDIFRTMNLTGDCERQAAELVSSGELRGSVVIPKGFRQDIKDGKGTELVLFIDNSKSTTAIVASNAVKAYVSDLNENISTEFILDAWKQLRVLNQNLRFLVTNLERAQPTALALKQKLEETNKDLSAIDFAAYQDTADDILSYLNLLEIQLDYVDSSMANLSGVPQVPQVAYMPNASIAMSEYRLNAHLFRMTYCNASSPLPITIENPMCAVIDYSDGVMDSWESDLSNLSVYRDDINTRIAELNSQASSLNDSLSRLSAIVSSSSEENSELRSDIQDLRQSILFLDEKTQNITATIIELNRSIDQFLSDIIRVTRELNQTIGILDSYTQKDPGTILKPVTVDSRPVFRDKLEIFYRLPGLMSIILLFITLFISSSLIVGERKGGTMARIFLSPISMFFYVFEKMVYLLLLCLLAVASMVIATLVFQVYTPVNLGLVVVFILASLVYISLGILIGAFSRSENTSLLTCLVIGFPLMFMSGAFSPPELMGKIVRTISQYLPLTLNIDLLENIAIYHTGLGIDKLVIMLVMAAVFYIAAVLLIRKSPTLK
ncbi:ABC transporter permease [Candidatus Woesearchaeota archaeon]|nr:ABC transporter permease [Candidatus Woesearchaeota archaeon]